MTNSSTPPCPPLNGTLGRMLWIVALAGALYRSHGHYDPLVLWALPFSLGLLFFPHKRSGPHEELAWGTVAFLFLLVDILSPLLIYRESRLDWNLARASFLLSALALLYFLRRPESKNALGLVFGMMASGYILILHASPNPSIDIFVVGKEAVAALWAGKNPYEITYTHIYGKEIPYQSFFGYPPLVLFVYLISDLIADIRYGWVMCHCIAGAILFHGLKRTSLSPRMRGLIPFCFLAFPAMPFIIEQAWIDPLSILLAILFVYRTRTKHFLSAALALGFFLGVKQSNVLALFFFLPWLYSLRLKNPWVFLWALLPLALVHIPFLIWNAEAYQERVLWMFSANGLTGGKSFELFPRPDALSFSADRIHRGLSPLPSLIAHAFFLASASGCAFLLRKNRVLFWTAMSAVFTVYFLLSPWAFCNYFWFASLGVWLSFMEAEPI